MHVQLVICIVFFIALLSVLGSRMPAGWNFNISGERTPSLSWPHDLFHLAERHHTEPDEGLSLSLLLAISWVDVHVCV